MYSNLSKFKEKSRVPDFINSILHVKKVKPHSRDKGVSSLNEFTDTPILVFFKIMPFKPELLRYKHVKKD